jgi:hypothetical protein
MFLMSFLSHFLFVLAASAMIVLNAFGRKWGAPGKDWDSCQMAVQTGEGLARPLGILQSKLSLGDSHSSQEQASAFVSVHAQSWTVGSLRTLGPFTSVMISFMVQQLGL